MKKLLSALLSLAVALSLTALPASALELEDAKSLLQTYYVDPLPEEIWSLDSLDEILEAIGDPYTVYMNAEEYQAFLSSVNGDTVVGIGASVENAYNDGYRIMSILPDSPALEAGLEAGDRIIAVDGVATAAGVDPRTMIGGREGTSVTITVISQSDGQRRDYTMERRSVLIPIVTYELVDGVAVIDCTSFGASTASVVQAAIEELDNQTAIWLMDLRSNPGGTDESAALTAGQFLGSAVMVYFRDSAGGYYYRATSPLVEDLTDKPLVILTSPHSASGSELFAAAIRDYEAGIALGQRTFGKGIAQNIYDESNTTGIFDGDCLKITTLRFFSPDGTTNHIIGVLPTLVIYAENAPAAALLLGQKEPSRAAGYLKLSLAGQHFYLKTSAALNADNRAAFTELLEALPPSALLYKGTGTRTWTEISPADLAREKQLELTPRSFSDLEGSEFEREIRTLAAYQLLGGYEDGTFRPDNTVTRAEFCTMAATALALPADHSVLDQFSDVSAQSWYADGISAMADMGFISGYGDGTFRPDSTITYQEMVTILSAVAAWANMNIYDLSQQEVSAADWATYYEYAPWAQAPARNLASLDALVGDLAPADLGTRQVAAGMLYQIMEGIGLLWD